MRTHLHKAIHLSTALLVVASFAGSEADAKAQTTAHRISASAKSGKAAHRANSLKKSRRRPRGQKAPAPDRISEIQQALGKDGSYTGKPSGKWDESTVEAMKKFQESHGLNPSGKLDAKTLQQLGLGSQTAGVAPPLSSTTATITPGRAVRQRQ